MAYYTFLYNKTILFCTGGLSLSVEGPSSRNGTLSEPLSRLLYTLTDDFHHDFVSTYSTTYSRTKPVVEWEENSDGTLSASYMPLEPGKYQISVKFDDKHISGSPFTANIAGMFISLLSNWNILLKHIWWNLTKFSV